MCIFSNRNDRELKKLRKILAKINALAPRFAAMSDDELKAMTPDFKQRLADGASLNDLLPEAFAVVREASTRVLGLRHFDVQILGGIVLHQGRIAEMATGEGKTLVSTLPAYLNGLTGKGVHVVTVNDYLAKRDAEWMGKVYDFLGLTVGVVVERMSPIAKRAAYGCDVVYATNHALGFDYLRDNMARDLSELLQREPNYAIIDEVDSILIDEARNPLILSGPTSERTEMYQTAQRIAKKCTPDDYVIDEEKNTITLTDAGVAKVENLLAEDRQQKERKKQNEAEGAAEGDEGGEYDQILNATALHYVNNALRANYMLKRDVDYAVVDKKEVVLIDKSTGRLMVGRRLNNGLHQAVEMKEGLVVQNATATLASISLQNYFRLYKKIAGMTGTAKEEELEFRKTYGLDVVSVPTNKPLCRVDEEDRFFKEREAKINAIVKDVKACREKGQPVLVGTTSVEKSEQLSERLKQEGIPHNVLNAKHDKHEAEIVAQAGRFGQVTIATNMAGRGTDIMLGGNPDYQTRKELESEGLEIAMRSRGREDSALDSMLKGIREQVDEYYQGLSRNEKDAFTADYVGQTRNAREAVELAKKEMILDRIHAFVGEAVNPFHASDPLMDEVMRLYGERYGKHKEETEADKQKVLAAGGLRVIGTERHDSRRIDNQLRGRSGRQGDVGSSVFYVSMEDDLLRVFGKPFGSGAASGLIGKLQQMMGEGGDEWIGTGLMNVGPDGQLSGKLITKRIKNAQSKVEGYHYSMRKTVLAYDDVMSRQREIIYEERRKVLMSDDVHEEIVKMVPSVISDFLADYIDYSIDEENWDYAKINGAIEKAFLPAGSGVVTKELAFDRSYQKIADAVSDAAIAFYEAQRAATKGKILLKAKIVLTPKQEENAPKKPAYVDPSKRAYTEVFLIVDPIDGMRGGRTLVGTEKFEMLSAVDRNWAEQMIAMEELRNGIGFRAIGNKDPVMCYTSEGFELFDQMSEEIRKQTVRNVFAVLKKITTPERMGVQVTLGKKEIVAEASELPPEMREGQAPGKTKKPGRNDPCPCGSGKKYKNCCGNK